MRPMLSRRLVTVVVPRCGLASSTAEAATEPPPPVARAVATPQGRPEGFVPAPYTRRPYPIRPSPNMVHDEFVNEGDATGYGARLTDYYKMQDHVRGLDSPAARIDFVNPYERTWTQFERKWHRRFHPVLSAPRKAWGVPAIPAYFDTLNFYKYITKTRLIEEPAVLNNFYNTLVPPTAKFERRLQESLKAVFQGRKPKSTKQVDTFLLAALEDAQLSLAHNVAAIQNYRLSTNERCESFWVRGGFLSMYDKLEVWDDYGTVDSERRGKPRFIGDDKRRLGELAFVHRDRLTAQFRTKAPLPVLAPFSQTELIEAPIFPEDTDIETDVIFSPKIFNVNPDLDPLWQCPGFEADVAEPFSHGHLAVKNMFDLQGRCRRWRIEADTDEYAAVTADAYTSTAIVSLFSWLNGQAHVQGFTRYNDIEAPLASQLVLSDGRLFSFAIGQLNTIAINVEMPGFENKRNNLCVVDGPHALWDEYDKETGKYNHYNAAGDVVEGLNPIVLSRLLQALMVKAK
uniref:Uncharacterized protein n=1 Tax=Panagrellus redivivus TaxID=6233 RepID=A0A7E4W5R2_PANRE